MLRHVVKIEKAGDEMSGQKDSGERTVVKGLSFNGVVQDGNTVQVDVKDGKIVRIRPFHFDWKYDRKPWRMEARGQDLRMRHEGAHPALHSRLQEPHQLTQPGHVSAEAGGLGSERGPWLHRPRGAQPAEPRQEQVRAHLLGRGHRYRRLRDTADREGVRALGRVFCSRTGTARARSSTPPTAATAR